MWVYSPTQWGSSSYFGWVNTPDSLIIVFVCFGPGAVTTYPLKMDLITVFEAFMGYCTKLLTPFNNHINSEIPQNIFSILPSYLQLSLCILVDIIGHWLPFHTGNIDKVSTTIYYKYTVVEMWYNLDDTVFICVAIQDPFILF